MKIKIYIYILFLLFCTACSSSVGVTLDTNSSNDGYKITKIKKQKNNVYIIYATRNDSIFKIASHYNGITSDNNIKLKVGTVFCADLRPYFNGEICGLQTMHQLGLAIDYYGVSIYQEPQKGINELYFCDDINGRYFNISKCIYKIFSRKHSR